MTLCLLKDGVHVLECMSCHETIKGLVIRRSRCLFFLLNMELLIYESSKVIAKTDPENYDRNYEKLNTKHARFRKGLEELRSKKWRR